MAKFQRLGAIVSFGRSVPQGVIPGGSKHLPDDRERGDQPNAPTLTLLLDA
jgi:hypothetical protein